MTQQEEDTDTLKERRICADCVKEEFLRDEIVKQGEQAECSYCGATQETFRIQEIAERVEVAFGQHYSRTPTEPEGFEYAMHADKESDYSWERHGEPVVWAIASAAQVSEAVATDIQLVLADKFANWDSAAIGEETEFDTDSYYEEKGPDDSQWQEDWREFERSLKTEARFFSQSAAQHLASVFDGIDAIRTDDGRPLIVTAGPGSDLHALYRARVFQSEAKLEDALERPDRHLGSPPSTDAAAGRMNALGVSVFYGANHAEVALAEVRPPVGSKVAVAQFEIIRPLHLLDLTALAAASIGGSLFDPTFGAELGRVTFLRNLTDRIVRPVMPDDEPFEYLATQAIADFLATNTRVPLDGIIFPSVQASDRALNIVLFHQAAFVERLTFPPGTEIDARSGSATEDGWEVDYRVVEWVPSKEKLAELKERRRIKPWLESRDSLADEDRWLSAARAPALRISLGSIEVHDVRAVTFETTKYPVSRLRIERSDKELF